MGRVEAVRSGQKRYFGMVCVKHPELNGERNAKNAGCIACSRERMRARRASDPEYHRRATRVAYEKWYAKNRRAVLDKSRQKRTGVDATTYVGLLRVQGGLCGVCGVELSSMGFGIHADHCHETGEPRGLLCGPCNQAEGLIKRSGLGVAGFCEKLRAYLESPPMRMLRS